MGYWGWRQMFSFCVSVLVVGCSTTQDTASTIAPTLLPPVTLIARARITPTPPSQLSIPESPAESSPTPIVYTIQRGDTLLGIASQFGIQLEVLKAANDNLNPLTLPIGATLVIPRPQFNAQGQPILPTHTPVALFLSAPACYPTSTGGILCMGLVTNTTSSSIGRVNVDIRLFHRDNSLLDEGLAGVEQSMIPAGAAAPYSLLFKAEWSGYGGVMVSLSSADLALADGQPIIELPILNQHHSFEGGVYEVIATLGNPGNKTARLTRAVLTLWDANGYLTGYRVMTLGGQVEAGGTVSLQINAVAQHGVPYRHNLFVEAEGTD
jgi:LysM repeat protein